MNNEKLKLSREEVYSQVKELLKKCEDSTMSMIILDLMYSIECFDSEGIFNTSTIAYLADICWEVGSDTFVNIPCDDIAGLVVRMYEDFCDEKALEPNDNETLKAFYEQTSISSIINKLDI